MRSNNHVSYDDRSVKPMSASLMRARIADIPEEEWQPSSYREGSQVASVEWQPKTWRQARRFVLRRDVVLLCSARG